MTRPDRGAEAADTVAGEPGPSRRSQPERIDVQSATTSEPVTRLSTQVSDLVRAELTLARGELQAKGKRLGAGVGLGGGARVLAVGGLLAFLTAAIAALALVLPVWASSLVVGVVLLIIAAVLGLLAPQTQHTMDQARQLVADKAPAVREAARERPVPAAAVAAVLLVLVVFLLRRRSTGTAYRQ